MPRVLSSNSRRTGGPRSRVGVEVDHGRCHDLGGVEHALVADRHAAGGDHRPGVPGRADRGRGHREVEGGHAPADIADVGGPAGDSLRVEVQGLRLALEPDRVGVGGALDRARELQLFVGEPDRSQPHHVVVDELRPGHGQQQLPVSGLHGEPGGGAGGQGRALGDVAGALEQSIDSRGVRVCVNQHQTLA